MKKTPLLILLLSCIFTAGISAQEFNQVSVGPGYSLQAYYSLSTGEYEQVEMDAWDLGFNVGPFSAGIIINEGSTSTTENPKPELKVYVTESPSLEALDTTGMTRIYNNEVSWDNGAFNIIGDPEDPFDYGWGNYNMNTHTLTGSKVFVVELRNGDFKKLMIDSMVNGAYYFTYADLDGSNKQQHTIVKAEYQDNSFAYFSFKQNAVVDIVDQDWDLLFTRYTRPLDAGDYILEYMVNGVLSGAGVQVAQADDINTDEVKFNDYRSELSDSLTIIGHDWKYFDLQNYIYKIIPDRAYFVKTADNKVYKLIFIDFEGSATGVTTLQKELVATVTSTDEASANVAGFTLFPNPAHNKVSFTIDIKEGSQSGQVSIYRMNGQKVYTHPVQFHGGFNVKTLQLNLPEGLYIISIRLKDSLLNRKLLIQ